MPSLVDGFTTKVGSMLDGNRVDGPIGKGLVHLDVGSSHPTKDFGWRTSRLIHNATKI